MIWRCRYEELEKIPVKEYRSKIKVKIIDKIVSIGCSCNGGSSAKGGTCCCGNAYTAIARR